MDSAACLSPAKAGGVPASPLTLTDVDRTAWVVAPGTSIRTIPLHRLPGSRTIAVGTVFAREGQPAAIYAADAAWWEVYLPDVRARCSGRRFAAQVDAESLADVELVPGRYCAGPTPDPDNYIHFGAGGGGANSGVQAIELARAWGARRIVLVGFDLRDGASGRYCTGNVPAKLWRDDPLWSAKRAALEALCVGLRDEHGIELLNVSPLSVIDGTTSVPLQRLLPMVAT
jgi:hypothetical protein